VTTLTQEDDIRVLIVEGELNHGSAVQLRQLAAGALEDGAHDFVIDLADCTGVDSAALEALTWLSRQSRERLGMTKLCMLSDALEQIMAITRLDQQLDICVTREEALASLQSPAPGNV